MFLLLLLLNSEGKKLTDEISFFLYPYEVVVLFLQQKQEEKRESTHTHMLPVHLFGDEVGLMRMRCFEYSILRAHCARVCAAPFKW